MAIAISQTGSATKVEVVAISQSEKKLTICFLIVICIALFFPFFQIFYGEIKSSHVIFGSETLTRAFLGTIFGFAALALLGSFIEGLFKRQIAVLDDHTLTLQNVYGEFGTRLRSFQRSDIRDVRAETIKGRRGFMFHRVLFDVGRKRVTIYTATQDEAATLIKGPFAALTSSINACPGR